MTSGKSVLTFVVMTLLCSGCSKVAKPREDQDASTVVAISGPVLLKRVGWTNYAPVLFGTVLRSDDLVQVGSAASANVACPDLSIVSLAPGNVGVVPCLHWQGLLIHGDSKILATRGAGSSGPILIYPAANKKASVRTRMSWMIVQQARRYEIAIEGSEVHWTRTVEAQALPARMCSQSYQCALFPYPADAQSLAEGKNYTITVKALGDDVPADQVLASSGFAVVDSQRREELNASLRRIRGSGLNRQAIDYLSANLYLSQELTGDATNLLQDLAADTQEPAVERLLGQAYLNAGLSRLAAFAYAQSAKEAAQKGDIEGQAVAEESLATIYTTAIFNPGEAKSHLTAAIGLYGKLGDDRALHRLTDAMQKLPTVGNP